MGVGSARNAAKTGTFGPPDCYQGGKTDHPRANMLPENRLRAGKPGFSHPAELSLFKP
jgi:hypothetical protein